jgi:hypothetical protein
MMAFQIMPMSDARLSHAEISRSPSIMSLKLANTVTLHTVQNRTEYLNLVETPEAGIMCRMRGRRRPPDQGRYTPDHSAPHLLSLYKPSGLRMSCTSVSNSTHGAGVQKHIQIDLYRSC